MRKTHLLSVFGAGLCLVAASGAIAGKGGHDLFEKLDADGDGQVTKAEVESKRAEHFASLDTDGDGQITAAEFEAAAQKKAAKRAEKMVEHMDKNGDGVVSEDEFGGAKKDRLFDKADANDDGTVSAEEWQAMKKHYHSGKHKK